MKKRLSLAVLACLLGLSGCASTSNTAATSAPLLEPVAAGIVTSTATLRDIKITEYRFGVVVPVVHTLSFLTSGVVGECAVKTGDTIEKYDYIAQIDESGAEEEVEELLIDRDYIDKKYRITLQKFDEETESINAAINLTAAKEALGQATNAELMEMELNELKLRGRDEKRAAIEDEWNKALDKFDSDYQSMNSSITKNILVSPYAGLILNCEIAQGISVNANQAVVTVADLNDYYIQLDDSNATSISLAGFNRMKEVNAYKDDVKIEVSYRGTDSKDNTCLNVSGDVKVGDYISVEFVKDEALNVLSVASDAVFKEGTQSYVYKLDGDKRVRAFVVTGFTNGMYTQICSGDIKEGDRIYVPQ